MGLNEHVNPSGDLLQALRRWLFLFCQCRSGQCLEPKDSSVNPVSSCRKNNTLRPDCVDQEMR